MPITWGSFATPAASRVPPGTMRADSPTRPAPSLTTARLRRSTRVWHGQGTSEKTSEEEHTMRPYARPGGTDYFRRVRIGALGIRLVGARTSITFARA